MTENKEKFRLIYGFVAPDVTWGHQAITRQIFQRQRHRHLDGLNALHIFAVGLRRPVNLPTARVRVAFSLGEMRQ